MNICGQCPELFFWRQFLEMKFICKLLAFTLLLEYNGVCPLNLKSLFVALLSSWAKMSNSFTFLATECLFSECTTNEIASWTCISIHLCVTSSGNYSFCFWLILLYTQPPFFLSFKGTQEWEFFWLRFWNLRYFFVSYVKILRFYKKIFLIGPFLGEVRFFRVVLGLRGMRNNFELGKIFFFSSSIMGPKYDPILVFW